MSINANNELDTNDSPMTNIAKQPASPDLMEKVITSNTLEGEFLPEGKVVENKDERIQYYYDEVIKHYKTSVEGIIQMGVTLYQAKRVKEELSGAC